MIIRGGFFEMVQTAFAVHTAFAHYNRTGFGGASEANTAPRLVRFISGLYSSSLLGSDIDVPEKALPYVLPLLVILFVNSSLVLPQLFHVFTLAFNCDIAFYTISCAFLGFA